MAEPNAILFPQDRGTGVETVNDSDFTSAGYRAVENAALSQNSYVAAGLQTTYDSTTEEFVIEPGIATVKREDSVTVQSKDGDGNYDTEINAPTRYFVSLRDEHRISYTEPSDPEIYSVYVYVTADTTSPDSVQFGVYDDQGGDTTDAPNSPFAVVGTFTQNEGLTNSNVQDRAEVELDELDVQRIIRESGDRVATRTWTGSNFADDNHDNTNHSEDFETELGAQNRVDSHSSSTSGIHGVTSGDIASTSDVSDIQSSSDVDHDSTVGGTTGTPHDHADPGDWDNDVTNTSTSLSGLDSSTDSHISASNPHSGSASTSDVSDIQSSSDVDHNSTQGGTSGTPHDHADPGDWDSDVTTAATSLSGLDSQVDTNISDISSLQSDKLDVTAYNPEADTHDRYTDSEAQSAVGGSTPWANSDLSNSSVTVAGNVVSLGNSTSISHGDLTGINSSDHHTRYSDSEARSAVDGSTLTSLNLDGTYGDHLNLSRDGNIWNITIGSGGGIYFDESDGGGFSYNSGGLYEDGDRVATRNWTNSNFNDYTFSESHNDLSNVSSDDHHTRYSDSEATSAVGGSTPWSNTDLQNSTVTVAGNSVSLGGSTGVSHSNLSGIGASDHHSRYADTEARSAIESGNLSQVEGVNSHRIRFDSNNSWIEITDHDNNRSDMVLGDLYVDDLSGGTWLADIVHSDLSGISSDDHHTRYSNSEARSAVGGSTPWDNSDLSNSSVTVAGNAVSLGGSTDISHSNLSGIGSSDHHSRYSDSEARSAVDGASLNDGDYTSSFNVPVYQSESDLPTGSEGDIAYVIDTGELYTYN